MNTKKSLFDKALTILDFAPQTEYMLKNKLSKKGGTALQIAEVISRLKELELLDDSLYAKYYAAELVRLKSAGYYKVKEKLKSRGINDAAAEDAVFQAFEEAGGEDQVMRLFIAKNRDFFIRNFEGGNMDKNLYKLSQNGFRNCRATVVSECIEDLKREE